MTISGYLASSTTPELAWTGDGMRLIQRTAKDWDSIGIIMGITNPWVIHVESDETPEVFVVIANMDIQEEEEPQNGIGYLVTFMPVIGNIFICGYDPKTEKYTSLNFKKFDEYLGFQMVRMVKGLVNKVEYHDAPKDE